jgi:23S rRNA (uracil1939-C5)-methyltransferase
MTEIQIDRIGPGGEGVGSIDGRITFVPGVLPGERARVRVVEEKRRWARAELLEVIEAAPGRVTPPCPVFDRCGGCSWLHADTNLHARWKQSIVEQQLARIAKLDCEVRPTRTPSSPVGYRNKAVLEIASGRPAFHESRSHTLVPVDDCLVLHTSLRQMLGELGDLDGVTQLTLRTGVRTGDRMILAAGELPAQANDWSGSVVHARGHAIHVLKGLDHFHEEIAGKRLRITANAFFQVNTDGAELLVDLVGDALQPGPEDHLADLYAGGGLFAATVGRRAKRVTAVESGLSTRDDLQANSGPNVRVVAHAVEQWSDRADIVVCDPPRRGLQTRGVDVVVGTGARAIAYVSCDTGTFARDARALVDRGFALESVQPVDMFPQTAHVELVARFAR